MKYLIAIAMVILIGCGGNAAMPDPDPFTHPGPATIPSLLGWDNYPDNPPKLWLNTWIADGLEKPCQACHETEHIFP